jgi:type IV pilus assembly protein PilM
MRLLAKKAFVGLDLGHHAIKAVQLEQTHSGWRVTRTASIATPPEAIKDGVVVDQVAVSNAIRDLLRDSHITATAAHIAVAGASVVVRTVRIPKMPESTLRKSIKFEASRYVPSSVNDSYIEFEILGEADENQMDVMMVAAPKDVVESRIAACEGAGLEVESVDVEPFAAYRSLAESGLTPDWAEGTFALVDIGASTTNLSVVQDGVFTMTRSIPNGGNTLTDALKSYFKLGDSDAENGKLQLDLTELLDDAKPRENPPLRVLQPHLDDLVREVRRSLNYFQSQQTDGTEAKQVKRIIVTGGGAKLPGMAQYIAHKLQLPVESIGVLSSANFTHSGPVEETGLDLSVASGLAMRGFERAA